MTEPVLNVDLQQKGTMVHKQKPKINPETNLQFVCDLEKQWRRFWHWSCAKTIYKNITSATPKKQRHHTIAPETIMPNQEYWDINFRSVSSSVQLTKGLSLQPYVLFHQRLKQDSFWQYAREYIQKSKHDLRQLVFAQSASIPVLVIEKDFANEKPIFLRHVLHNLYQPAIIYLAPGAKATIFADMHDSNLQALDIWLDRQSSLFWRPIDGFIEGTSFRHTQAILAEHAYFDMLALQQGTSQAARAQNFIHMMGEHSHAHLQAAVSLHAKDRIDQLFYVDHTASHSYSKQVVRVLVDEQAQSSLQSCAVVAPDLQAVEAHQSLKGLLLSPNACHKAAPELQIWSDDVKCSHGSTTGCLDEQALYYMCARGLEPSQARKMLILAFLQEILEYCPTDSWSVQHWQHIVSAWLQTSKIMV